MHLYDAPESEAFNLLEDRMTPAAIEAATQDKEINSKPYFHPAIANDAPDASLKIFFRTPLAALQHKGYIAVMLRCTMNRLQPEITIGAILMATPKTAAKTAAQTAEKAAKTVEAETAKMTAQTEDFMTAVQDQFQSAMNAFGDNAETMRVQAEESFHAMRENTEKTAERFQTVNSEIAAAARDEMADAVDFMNELGRAKSMTDAFEIQRNYWTNLFDTRVERARKITETSVEAAQDSLKPINDTMTAAFDTTKFEKFFPFAVK